MHAEILTGAQAVKTLIHSLSGCLLNSCYVPYTTLGSGRGQWTKQTWLWLQKAYRLADETSFQQAHNVISNTFDKRFKSTNPLPADSMGRDAFSAENDDLRKSRNIQPLTKLQKSPHMAPGYSGDRVDWCHKLNVYVPPPLKSVCWVSNPQWDSIQGWILCKVLRFKWGHQSGISMMEDQNSLSLPFSFSFSL